MRLKGEGGALEGRQLSAGVPPPSRRDLKLSSRLSVRQLVGFGTNPRTTQDHRGILFPLLVNDGRCFSSCRCLPARLAIDNLPNDLA